VVVLQLGHHGREVVWPEGIGLLDDGLQTIIDIKYRSQSYDFGIYNYSDGVVVGQIVLWK
jgi:hypothetical protein